MTRGPEISGVIPRRVFTQPDWDIRRCRLKLTKENIEYADPSNQTSRNVIATTLFGRDASTSRLSDTKSRFIAMIRGPSASQESPPARSLTSRHFFVDRNGCSAHDLGAQHNMALMGGID
jgi:hypothetical protein